MFCVERLVTVTLLLALYERQDSTTPAHGIVSFITVLSSMASYLIFIFNLLNLGYQTHFISL